MRNVTQVVDMITIVLNKTLVSTDNVKIHANYQMLAVTTPNAHHSNIDRDASVMRTISEMHM